MMQLILNYLKVGGFSVILAVALTGSMLWLHYQHQALRALREQNTQLANQNTRLEARLLQLKTQAANLTSVLEAQKKQHQNLEEKNEQTHQQLHQAVAQAPCARQSVPADVIQLQRDAIKDRNALSR